MIPASSGGTMSSGFSDAASPTASFGGGGGGPFAARGDILSLTPSSEVVFEVNAATNSLVAKVKIANTSAKIVVFKVKHFCYPAATYYTHNCLRLNLAAEFWDFKERFEHFLDISLL